VKKQTGALADVQCRGGAGAGLVYVKISDQLFLVKLSPKRKQGKLIIENDFGR
jgi:hypothetical protein